MGDDRLATLYETYAPTILALCRRLLGDKAAAEDAMHETFLRVHRHLDRAGDGRTAMVWIYRIATNYCFNQIRDGKNEPLAVDVLPDRAGQSLEDVLADRDFASRLIRGAPVKLRAAAWLYHVDELEQTEIADVLEISLRTVVTRLAAFIAYARRFARRAG